MHMLIMQLVLGADKIQMMVFLCLDLIKQELSLALYVAEIIHPLLSFIDHHFDLIILCIINCNQPLSGITRSLKFVLPNFI